MAWARRVAMAAVVLLAAGVARAESPPAEPLPPGIYALGDRALTPGMTLYVFRAEGAHVREIGQLRVVRVRGNEVALELVGGSAAMASGDHIEVEASSPSEWEPYAVPSTGASGGPHVR